MSRVDDLLQRFAACHVGEFMPEAVDEISLCAVEPVGRLDEQRLDVRPSESPLRQPGVGRVEPRRLSSKVVIRSPDAMVCPVRELDVPIERPRVTTFVVCRLVVGLVVGVLIVRLVPGRMVVVGRMLGSGRFVIATMIAIGSIGVVAAYSRLVSVSGHTPWF